MVAIMRSIEKEQTLPTVSMIQALFQQELEPEDGEGWEGDFEFFEQQLTEEQYPLRSRTVGHGDPRCPRSCTNSSRRKWRP